MAWLFQTDGTIVPSSWGWRWWSWCFPMAPRRRSGGSAATDSRARWPTSRSPARAAGVRGVIGGAGAWSLDALIVC